MNSWLKKEVILVIFLFLIPFALGVDSLSDFDGDGMDDSWEFQNGLRYDVVDSMNDPDNDGLSNLEEFWLKSDPQSKDSDGDEISDYNERELGSDPLVEDKTIWPLVIMPILILLFILVLFLFEKYHWDLWLHKKFGFHAIEKDDYKPVSKKISSEGPVLKTNEKVEAPKIKFRNLTEIYKVREEKKKQKQELVKRLSSFGGGKSPEYMDKIKGNKLNEVPKEVEGLISTLETVHKDKEKKAVLNGGKPSRLHKLKHAFKVKSFEKKDVLPLVKKKEKTVSMVKPVKGEKSSFDTKKNSKNFSSDQKPKVFDKLKSLSKNKDKKDVFDKLRGMK
jgi:hypothetical protein